MKNKAFYDLIRVILDYWWNNEFHKANRVREVDL